MLPFFLRTNTLVSIGVAPFRFPPTAGGLARGKSGDSGPAGRERRGRHSPDLDVSSASARGRPAHATLHHHHDHHYHGEFQHGYGMSYRSSYQQQKGARAYTHSVNQTTFLVNEHKDNNSYDREHRVHTPWRYGTTLLTDTDGSGGRVSPLQSSLRPASPGVLPLLGEYESVDFVNDDIMVRYIDNTIPYQKKKLNVLQCAADCLHGDIVSAHARTCVGLCGVYAVSAVHAYTRSTLPPLQLSLSSFQWFPPLQCLDLF